MADPDLELRGGEEGGGGVDLLPLTTIFPSVISSFLPKIRGGGGSYQVCTYPYIMQSKCFLLNFFRSVE